MMINNNKRCVSDCFGKNTKILMANGSSKLISEIRVGEHVATFNGKPVQVRNVIFGMEETMIYIETSTGKCIVLTGNHPIFTGRGRVIASRLNIADKILLQDGSLEQMGFLYQSDYNDRVYNLDLGEPQKIIANSMVCGDFNSRNEAQENQ